METQSQVAEMVTTVAKSQGVSVNVLMASDYGMYWKQRYDAAELDTPTLVKPTRKEAPVVETNGFTLLQARAKELLVKNSTMTEAQAVVKASEMFPDLTTRHTDEIRKAIAQG